MINQSNAQYTAMRNEARQHGEKAHQYFAQSQAAYQAGDGGRAHELSEMGKAEMRKKDQVDDQAEEWIYRGLCATSLIFSLADILLPLQKTTPILLLEPSIFTVSMSKRVCPYLRTGDLP